MKIQISTFFENFVLKIYKVKVNFLLNNTILRNRNKYSLFKKYPQ